MKCTCGYELVLCNRIVILKVTIVAILQAEILAIEG